MKSSVSQGVLMVFVLGGALSFAQPTVASERFVSSNAIDKCQAFTPGISNTIRNRARGAENVGSKAIALACSFEFNRLKGAALAEVKRIDMTFVNNSTKTESITCTMLPGVSGAFGDTKSATIEVVAGNQLRLEFDDDFVADGAAVTCNLPPLVTLGRTIVEYNTTEAD